MSKTNNVTARVHFEVIIENSGGHWGDECTMAQVKKQAVEGAEGTLRRLLQVDLEGDSLKDNQRRSAAKYVGKGRLLKIEIVPVGR